MRIAQIQKNVIAMFLSYIRVSRSVDICQAFARVLSLSLSLTHARNVFLYYTNYEEANVRTKNVGIS